MQQTVNNNHLTFSSNHQIECELAIADESPTGRDRDDNEQNKTSYFGFKMSQTESVKTPQIQASKRDLFVNQTPDSTVIKNVYDVANTISPKNESPSRKIHMLGKHDSLIHQIQMIRVDDSNNHDGDHF